eukprot:1157722-Pelagomonas_calceolata.AAC.6
MVEMIDETHMSVKDMASLRQSVCEAATLNSSPMRPEHTSCSWPAMTDCMHLQQRDVRMHTIHSKILWPHAAGAQQLQLACHDGPQAPAAARHVCVCVCVCVCVRARVRTEHTSCSWPAITGCRHLHKQNMHAHMNHSMVLRSSAATEQ